MTGRPLDREATAASKRALALSGTDTVSGHVANALTVLLLDVAATHQDGSRTYAAETLSDIEARLRAALAQLQAVPELDAGPTDYVRPLGAARHVRP